MSVIRKSLLKFHIGSTAPRSSIVRRLSRMAAALPTSGAGKLPPGSPSSSTTPSYSLRTEARVQRSLRYVRPASGGTSSGPSTRGPTPQHAVLADLGYEGEAGRLTCPIKKPSPPPPPGRRRTSPPTVALSVEQHTINMLHSATRAQAERGNSLLKTNGRSRGCRTLPRPPACRRSARAASPRPARPARAYRDAVCSATRGDSIATRAQK